MYVVWRGVESIRFLQSFSAPFMLVMSLILLFWMLHKAGGFGPMLSAPSRFHTTGSFLRFFFPSLTAMVGYWATLSLNIPDFTRYAKSQDSQIVGQAFGLPVAMVLVLVYRDRVHFGVGHHLWRAGVVADHAAWDGSISRWRRCWRWLRCWSRRST